MNQEKGKIAFQAYLDWESGLKSFEPIHAELQTSHTTLLYGGTIDMIAKVNGVLTIVDFKTSKHVYPGHVLQISAYREMYVDSVPTAPKDIPVMVLHISKTSGKFATQGA